MKESAQQNQRDSPHPAAMAALCCFATQSRAVRGSSSEGGLAPGITCPMPSAVRSGGTDKGLRKPRLIWRLTARRAFPLRSFGRSARTACIYCLVVPNQLWPDIESSIHRNPTAGQGEQQYSSAYALAGSDTTGLARAYSSGCVLRASSSTASVAPFSFALNPPGPFSIIMWFGWLLQHLRIFLSARIRFKQRVWFRARGSVLAKSFKTSHLAQRPRQPSRAE